MNTTEQMVRNHGNSNSNEANHTSFVVEDFQLNT
jgi:hypothetical protein